MRKVTQVNLHEARTHLSRLVDRAAKGEEIVIARSGKPVARLVPIERNMTRRQFGGMKGLIHVPDDFDDDLPPEELALWYEGEIEPPS